MLGLAAGGISSLSVPGAGVWSIGFGIAQTVFDGGRLDHQRKAAIAAYERAAALYRGTVLSAFQEIDWKSGYSGIPASRSPSK